MKKVCLFIVAILCVCLLVGAFASCAPAEVDPIDDNYRVFYQIFVGSFSDSNGDGIGDIRGIINRMDYLNDGNINSGRSLGVQGLWLSPIFKSPTYHKYDATDYYQIDPQFGTEDDLKDLLEICHERNVKVILDLAINHTASDNMWFINFKSAQVNNKTEDKYYDFYTCVTGETQVANRKYNAIINSGGKYYECNFDNSMPELNFDNKEVRDEMVNVAKHYLDLGIDGFRFDAVKYIYYGDNVQSAEFWDWYIGELKKIKPDIYTVGECWDGDSAILQYYSALNCFSFASSQSTGVIARAALYGDVDTFVKYVESWQTRIKAENPDAMYIPFITNHDLDRAAGMLPLENTEYTDDGTIETKPAYMAANIYLLCSGSPFIYYGEEIGMKGARGGANTDANRRLAMLWGDNDTVTDPVGTTFNPDLQINGTVKSQQRDSNSLLNYYAKVISIRNKYPQIARGDYTALLTGSKCAGFTINYQGETTVLLHNTGFTEAQIDISTLSVNVTTLLDYVGQGKATLNGNTLKIAAQTSVILK